MDVLRRVATFVGRELSRAPWTWPFSPLQILLLTTQSFCTFISTNRFAPTMELRSPAPSLDVVFASPSPAAIKRRRTVAISTPTPAPARAAAAVSTATVHIPLWQKMAVGGVAGVVGTVSVFPIDLIKTRVQLAPSTAAGTSMGITTVVMDVCSRYGLSGLYRGMPATALATLPEKAIKLGVNDYLRDVFCGHDRSRETTKHQMAAGACTAVVQVLAT